MKTKDLPANFWLFTSRFSVVGWTPALCSFLISCRLAGSEKNSTMAAPSLVRLPHFFELLFRGSGQFFERGKMFGQQFAGAFADEE